MSYKRYRTHIDNKGNKLTEKQVRNIKADYEAEHQCCECCHGQFCNNFNLAIHHHIKQQYRYLNDYYVLEFHDNYSMLGSACHGICEHNESQYRRQLEFISGKPFEYWNELKDGFYPEYYVEMYKTSEGIWNG